VIFAGNASARMMRTETCQSLDGQKRHRKDFCSVLGFLAGAAFALVACAPKDASEPLSSVSDNEIVAANEVSFDIFARAPLTTLRFENVPYYLLAGAENGVAKSLSFAVIEQQRYESILQGETHAAERCEDSNRALQARLTWVGNLQFGLLLDSQQRYPLYLLAGDCTALSAESAKTLASQVARQVEQYANPCAAFLEWKQDPAWAPSSLHRSARDETTRYEYDLVVCLAEKILSRRPGNFWPDALPKALITSASKTVFDGTYAWRATRPDGGVAGFSGGILLSRVIADLGHISGASLQLCALGTLAASAARVIQERHTVPGPSERVEFAASPDEIHNGVQVRLNLFNLSDKQDAYLLNSRFPRQSFSDTDELTYEEALDLKSRGYTDIWHQERGIVNIQYFISSYEYNDSLPASDTNPERVNRSSVKTGPASSGYAYVYLNRIAKEIPLQVRIVHENEVFETDHEFCLLDGTCPQ